ncbi:MAG: glycosyltransferase family 2 protein [Pyrinomonadaceae bacterium]|nr:glycosyltransferase family 2 protein [Pyrinomonadaceae bacterium]
MLVFYFFASVLIFLGLLSLRGGFYYLAHFRRELSKEEGDYAPRVTVIAPCRGLDQGLRENISALFEQDYPSFEIIFVSDREEDPALLVVEEVRRKFSGAGPAESRIIIAGQARACGQKVHNLLAAVREAHTSSEVFVFVDTDARPFKGWLRALVRPLSDETLGAATGYRWFVPVRGGFSSRMRSVWNASIASALGASRDKNFCWGGSTAIRRETFERVGMIERWHGALSDDFAVTRALQALHLPIHFVPACLTASLEDCSFRELLEFTTRQMKITRVYAAHLWKAVLLSGLVFVPIFFGGIAIVAVRAALGLSYAWPLALLAIIYGLGVWKAWLRWRAVKLVLVGHDSLLRRDAFAQLFLWPLSTLLFLYNAMAASLSRSINWRGITYELRSPTETIIKGGARGENSAEIEGIRQEF